MNVRYRVELSQAERCELTAMLSKGKRAARKLKRAQILLAADAGRSDEEIAYTVAVGGSTVYRTKRRFVEDNLERALSEDPRPGAERKLTGKEEAPLRKVKVTERRAAEAGAGRHPVEFPLAPVSRVGEYLVDGADTERFALASPVEGRVI
jgi:hypothetical protein